MSHAIPIILDRPTVNHIVAELAARGLAFTATQVRAAFEAHYYRHAIPGRWIAGFQRLLEKSGRLMAQIDISGRVCLTCECGRVLGTDGLRLDVPGMKKRRPVVPVLERRRAA